MTKFQCCGFGMFIPDPGSWFLSIPDTISRIPDPKTATKERGEKNLLSYLLLEPQISQIINYFIFEMLKKKIWADFQSIIGLFTQKIVTKLSKIWVWDPGSEIRDPGVKKVPDPGSRICNTAKFILSTYTNEPRSELWTNISCILKSMLSKKFIKTYIMTWPLPEPWSVWRTAVSPHRQMDSVPFPGQLTGWEGQTCG